jgi:hypothetical protein
MSEVDVAAVTHGEAPDPSAPFVCRRQRGGEVIEDTGGGVGAVELDGDQLHDPREQVADADVLLHLLEEALDLPCSIQPEPHQVPHHLHPSCKLITQKTTMVCQLLSVTV